MKILFADSFFYFAFLNSDDAAHEQAEAFFDEFDGKMATTAWVLTELADGMADPLDRLTNWGTRELQIALPAKVLLLETARRYCRSQAASVREKSGKLIFKFLLEEEPTGECADGTGDLSTLLQIRDELAQGDLRSLYLGWLLGSQAGELDSKEAEPAVPPNLGSLSAAQQCFADFFQLDPDLLAVAAKNSSRTGSEPADRTEFSSWIASLPAADKDDLLVRVAAGGEAQACMELQAKFHRLRSANQFTVTSKPRSLGTLLAAVEIHQQERQQKAQRTAVMEKEHRDRQAAIARGKYLDSLKGQTDKAWTTVETLAATRQPKNYDLAVQHVVDLRDFAKRECDQNDFTKRFEMLRQRHSSKKSFMHRLAKAGL